jgi:WS/DGAT/MGAT family acyltransferase
MSSVDTAWLHMDTPGNAMMIVGVMATATPVRWSRFRRLLERRFLGFPRFRQRPVQDALGASWVEDTRFNLDAHVKRAALPEPAGRAELEELAAELASTPLDSNRPMWQAHLVERFLGGSAWILRIHHCYADGVAMVNVLLSIMEHEAVPAPTRGARRGVAEGARLIDGGLQHMLQPEQVVSYAVQAGAMVGELARVLALPDDPETPLRGALTGRKRVAWAGPIPLHEVKAVGKALDCTVNDVLMSTVAGALGSHLREQEFDVTDLVVRAAVPVNLRGAEEAPALGNRFGLVLVDLPLGIRSPLQRVYAVHDGMSSLKGSMQPPMTLMVLGLMGLLPAAVQSPAIDALSRKGSLVASNVAGPRVPLFMCGQRISEMYFWVPQSGTMGVGISILSYAGQVFFGLIADRSLVVEPRSVMDRIGPEFERLLLAATVGALAAREWQPKPSV